MFSGLKKRVSSVLAEGRILSETLSNTYIRQNSSSSTTTTVGITSPAATPTAGRNTPTNVATATALASDFPHQLLNASAGVSQLASQELAWQQIHAGTVANAAAADACDAQIQLVRSQTERSAVAVSDMQHSLCAVPAISRQLIECRQMLGDIGELCGRIELGLHGLEDVLEELELQERQLQLNIDLAVYRDGKMGENHTKSETLLNSNGFSSAQATWRKCAPNWWANTRRNSASKSNGYATCSRNDKQCSRRPFRRTSTVTGRWARFQVRMHTPIIHAIFTYITESEAKLPFACAITLDLMVLIRCVDV